MRIPMDLTDQFRAEQMRRELNRRIKSFCIGWAGGFACGVLLVAVVYRLTQ